MPDLFQSLISRYKSDPESVYHTWFLNSGERLKAFRSVRLGVAQVISDIQTGKFGNDFKGSSLEFVLNCITEQKQVFEGAAHPFYWKPKLRIPDIYENQPNKIAFGQFLEKCLNATKEEQILKEIAHLDDLSIKGLGPAVASILYFLHPTLIPPCNTAIVNGFNTLFGEKRKLGSWQEYLKMRETILARNSEWKSELSNDLGAIGGFLFDVGVKKIVPDEIQNLTAEEKEKIDSLVGKRRKDIRTEREEEGLHSEMQYHLLKIGKALGYDVISAVNDRSRQHQGNLFSFVSLQHFPVLPVDEDVLSTIKLVDVLWFEKGTSKIVCGFEVEKSTSIYSGILRLSDLFFSLPDHQTKLFLVVPNQRETEVIMQLGRPSIKIHATSIQYILFSELRDNCDALCRFGENHAIMSKIAKKIT